MSERIIKFTKIRVPMLILSLLVITGGIVGTVMRGGFTFGIDFLAGMNMRVQVADQTLRIIYTGTDTAVLDISDDILEIDILKDGGLTRDENLFALSDYSNITSLAAAVSVISDITAEALGDSNYPATSILALNSSADISAEEIVLVRENLDPKNYISIGEVRTVLSSVGQVQIQTAGKAYAQEFIIRLQDKDAETDFSVKKSEEILKLLGDKYGALNIVVKQTDYVGPKFSQSLGYQAFSLTGFALLFILAYIWFRFKLAYAVSAITALVHDVFIMIGFIGTFMIEINTATIAAVLTIIGYSLNDTIVIFDRIRENQLLLKERNFERVINISISQSLSRTLLTSITTLLAVTAIYVFGSGMIKIFALNLIIGVVVGTYSSVFIASSILLSWVNRVKKNSTDNAEKKYVEKETKPVAVVDTTKEIISSDADSGAEGSTESVPASIQRRPKKKRYKR